MKERTEASLMAAYAALLSLMHTIHHIQTHPRPPISLHPKKLLSLTQNLTFLQNFLERFHTTAQDDLESRIADAAYAAEDAIESHIVDQIEDVRPYKRIRYIISVDLNEALQRVIQDMDLIKKEVQQKIECAHLHEFSLLPSRSAPTRARQNSPVVGLDDALAEIIDKLTGEPDKLEVIPIIGMGGIGKTTLVRNVYDDPLVRDRFAVLAWVTISQEFSRGEILRVLCQEINKNGSSQMTEDELAEGVYRELFERRYLIVMDDVWSIEAWDAVKFFFPDNKNASRIMVTTRLSNLASQLSDSYGFQMKFLDKDKSWELLNQIVFGEEGCSIELEDMGRKIAENCRGLPLSIVVTGGLLAKSDMSREYWEYTLRNLSSSVINLENEEYCLQILRTSYVELPVHLKPCFLYMGVFPEDDIIYVSNLIKLWVAEAFLKPTDGKSLEEVAKACLDELIERNLILVHELRWNGKVRLCKIHDLLRDLCLREARKQRFLCVSMQDKIPESIHLDRRICFHGYSPQFLESASLARSLLVIAKDNKSKEPPASLSFRLLRVYSSTDRSFNDETSLTSVESVFRHANLRYFSVQVDPPCKFPSSWSRLWNLQTLNVDSAFSFEPIIAPPEIWEMPQLRHVMFKGLQLPDPPRGEDAFAFALENLQTLSGVKDFKCNEDVVRRIPNIKTLRVEYSTDRLYGVEGLSSFCLCNLGQLQKLERLRIYLSYPIPETALSQVDLPRNLAFSNSLKKLTLRCTMLYWEELTAKVGSLPRLEVLKLEFDSCVGPEWATVEGQFCSLKFLKIGSCSDLKCWKTDNTHFPRLEHLVLEYLEQLEGIPSCIGDISTLQSITLIACSLSVEDSAQIIKEEQEYYENLDLKVHFGSN